MPPPRGGKPRNQAVIDAFQSIILPNRIVSAVECLYCHRQMASETTRQQTTQGIEIDEEKLLNMEDRLLQEEFAMARLNPSNDEVLGEFLNNIIDGEVAMEHSNN